MRMYEAELGDQEFVCPFEGKNCITRPERKHYVQNYHTSSNTYFLKVKQRSAKFPPNLFVDPYYVFEFQSNNSQVASDLIQAGSSA